MELWLGFGLCFRFVRSREVAAVCRKFGPFESFFFLSRLIQTGPFTCGVFVVIVLAVLLRIPASCHSVVRTW